MADGGRQTPPLLEPAVQQNDGSPQVLTGQSTQFYLAQMIGQLSNTLQQNQCIQMEFHREQLRHQMLMQEQLAHLATRPLEVRTGPDPYSLITVFNGNSADNATEWIANIQRIASQYNWTSDMALSTAIGRLSGKAKEWHYTFASENVGWEEWKTHFLNHFVRVLTLREWTLSVETRSQTPGEGLSEYIRAKLKLVNDCPVRLSSRDKIDFLITGIADETTARMLRLRQCKDERDLLDAVSCLDIYDRPLFGDELHQVSKLSPNSYAPRKHPERPVMARTPYKKGMNKEDMTCFRCAQRGHLSFECRNSLRRDTRDRKDGGPRGRVNCVLRSVDRNLPVVEGHLDGHGGVKVLLDSGSEVSLINSDVLSNTPEIGPWRGQNKLAILGTTYTPLGLVNKHITVGDFKENVQLCVVENAPYDVLLGADWRQQAGLKLTLYPNCDVKLKRVNQDSLEMPNFTTGFIRLLTTPEQPEISSTSCDKGLKCEDGILQQIQDVVENCAPDVSYQTRARLHSLLSNYRAAFTTPEKQLGYCPSVEHSIHLKNDAPTRSRPYRYSSSDRQFIRKTLEEWKQNDIIEDTSSYFAAPVVLVEQPNHSTTPKRLCIDYRRLNDNTIKINYPMPVMEDVIETVVSDGARYFNVLDIKTAFMTVPIRPEDRYKTAFITQDSTYQFKRMPFGLCNAPATMQKIMNTCYADIPHTKTYMDDIGQGSRTSEGCLDILEEALKRTVTNGLLMDLDKCQIMKHVVKFLGYLVSEEGKTPDPDRVRAVDRFQGFTTPKELKSFVQFASHYRKFIKNFAQICKPLSALLRKDVAFKWTDECQVAVTVLKQILKSPPILSHFCFGEPLAVYVDSSHTGLGAVLVQIRDGREVVIEYASRSLNTSDMKLHINALECMAVHWALTEKFRIYLYGAGHFIVYSDNWSVSFLKDKSVTNRRFARWVLDLQEFDYEVKHVPGKANTVADSLSRLPDEQLCAVVIVARDSRLSQIQHQDPDLRKIIDSLVQDRVTEIGDEHSTSYKMMDGILVIGIREGAHINNKIVVPQKLRDAVLKTFHDQGGHMDAKKTLSRVRRAHWWDTVVKDVTKYVRECPICQRMNRNTTASVGLLRPRIWPSVPYECVSVDHFGPMERYDEFTHVVLSVDHATRHVIAEPVTSTDSSSFIQFLSDCVFSKYGVPVKIISDCAGCFSSRETREFLSAYGVHQEFTPPYHPSSNGLVERTVATIKSVLRKKIAEGNQRWPELVRPSAMAINTVVQSSLKHSPFFLLHGYHPRICDELFLGFVTAEMDRLQQIETLLDERKNSGENMLKAQENMKRRFDRGRKESDIKVGDSVLYTTGTRRDAMAHLFEGPYVVARDLGDNVYVIQSLGPEGIIVDVKTAHSRQLKPWRERQPTADDDAVLPMPTRNTIPDAEDADLAATSTREDATGRPRRPKRLPLRYQDFDMDFSE